MNLFVIIPVLIISSVRQGLCDKTLIFQGFNQLSNESRAVIYLRPDLGSDKSLDRDSLAYDHDPEPGGDAATVASPHTIDGEVKVLSDLSVCLWLKVHYFRQTTSYVFSYATSYAENNELNFGIQYNRILIAVGGKYVYGKKGVLFMPYTWYHICFIANSEEKTATFYVNGEINKVEGLNRRHILLNGSLVLGQETDAVDGGYHALQSFSGAITGFNLYSKPLNADEVSRLSLCSPGVEEGDLVAWSKAEWEISGPVTVDEIPQEDYCIKEDFKFVVLPKKRTLVEAQRQCGSLKSTLALPGNQVENSRLYFASEPFSEVCQPHNHATAFMWLGAIKNSKGNWTDQKGNPVSFTNFHGSQYDMKCSAYKIPPNYEQWTALKCSSSYELCVACQEKDPVILKMRGLCESQIHSTYFKMVDQYGNMPLFRGFTKYMISYNENGTWNLLNVLTGNTIAKYFNPDGEIPFGKKAWKTTTNYDICQKSSDTPIALSLSACYDWEFTCNDGTCINLSERCDLRVDCPDNSDEIGCGKLSKPKDYLGKLPPPGLQLGSPLLLNVSIGIHGFSEINIRDMKLIIDFTMKINWTDSRLRYKNLSPTTDLNFIDTDSVWLPKIDLVNAHFPKTFRTGKELHVMRISSPEKDDPSRIFRDEMYEGASNPLQLTEKFNVPFICTMNMKNFPFDKQHCDLHIRFSSAKKVYMEWNELMANYLGQVVMAEYIVEDVTIKNGTDEGYSLVTVGITFSRRYGYYMTSAYMPTIMLMIISYASLFCKKESYDLRIMMALTTLLVLYGLYQQISDDLPRTAYTKAIDVWCFFCLTFIFSQVILHVFVNRKIKLPNIDPCFCYTYKIKEFVVNDGSEMTSSRASGLENPTDGMNSDAFREGHHYYFCNPLAIARIFYVVLFATFCAIYWAVVLNSE